MAGLIRRQRIRVSPKKQFEGRPVTNREIDLARQAKLIAPANALTPTDKRLQELWRQHPNRYDYEGVVVNPATGQEYSTSTISYTALIPSGAIARIHNRISSIPDTLAQTRHALVENESSLNTYRERLGTPFAHEQRLNEMQTELISLERSLQEPVPAEAR